MKLKVYTYKNCGTCRKAVKWLDDHGIEYTQVPIREKPPTKRELKVMLGCMDEEIRKLFNTSGRDYKELKLKDSLPGMSEKEAFDLLNSNGNLVKRPFVLGDDVAAAGFKEDVWRKLFL